MGEIRGDSIGDGCPWHTRAWCFQERVLSPRTLVFTGGTVYWACRSAMWHETREGEPDGHNVTNQSRTAVSNWRNFPLKRHPWPDLRQYFDLVEGYNRRNLTFESDAVNAFTAITTVMSNSFPGGFLFGIPVFLFDIGMLWTRASPLTRRNGFPSWSWLGWAGDVRLLYEYAEAWNPRFSYNHAEANIRPLVNWYSTHRDTNSRQLIDNSYHLYGTCEQNPNFRTPAGWIKTWDEEDNRHAFYHENLPQVKFKFPIPLFPAITDDQTRLSTPHLKFVAESCTLVLGRHAFEWTSIGCLEVDLYDPQGHWAGILESPFKCKDDYVRGSPCELIAISQGYAKELVVGFRPLVEMEKRKELKKSKIYEFYNILWVEYAAGVAHRKALGRVWKDAWKRQNVKTIEVVLG